MFLLPGPGNVELLNYPGKETVNMVKREVSNKKKEEL